MVKESLPIKCMEAVILGVYLTNGVPGLKQTKTYKQTIFF
jgi:hypothetical protein